MTTRDSRIGRRLVAVVCAVAWAAGGLAGCAKPSLVSKEQAAAIERRDRALAAHAEAIQARIRESGKIGALVFLDSPTGPPVVLPGDSPYEAWTGRLTSSDGVPPPSSVPDVLTFVYRADVPQSPAPVLASSLQRQEAVDQSLAALENRLRETQRRTDERFDSVRQDLAAANEAIAATRSDAEQALAAVKADIQQEVAALADDLAEARRLVLQTAELAYINRAASNETATGLKKVATASQELTANSARLAEALRTLSDTLATQLKELAARLDALEQKISDVK